MSNIWPHSKKKPSSNTKNSWKTNYPRF